MSKIDWRNAPLSATHGRSHADGVDFYKRNDEGKWVYFDARGQWSWAYGTSESDCCERPTPFNDDGLPEIGSHAHVYDPEGLLVYGAGEDGEVIAHVENTAVIRMSYGLGCFTAKHLRTAEQIAAEERKEFIESLAGELGGHWSEEAKSPHRDTAAYLYSIGYRKQVKP